MAVKPKMRRDLEVTEIPDGHKTNYLGMDIAGTSG